MDAMTTFRDLQTRTGNELVVAVMNLSKQRPVLLSVCATPGMSIVDAVLASACIPLLLVPITARTQITDIRDGMSLISPGDLLCDGGFAFHNPDEQLDGHFSIRPEQTLSINTRTIEDVAYETRDSLPLPTTITPFIQLLMQAYRGVLISFSDQLLTLEQRILLQQAGLRGAHTIIEHDSDLVPTTI